MVEQSFVLVYIWHATVLLIFVATAACKLVLQIFAPVDHNLRTYGPGPWLTGPPTGLRARALGLRYGLYRPTGLRALRAHGPGLRAYGPGPGASQGSMAVYIYIYHDIIGGGI